MKTLPRKSGRVGHKLLTGLLLCLAVCILLTPLAPAVMADTLPDSEIKALQDYPHWVGTKDCGAAPTATTAGAGAADGAVFPNLDPTAMASSIDKFIVKENPSSKLKGLGSIIVASAKAANVSPFLIVAIAHEETGMSDPSDFNVSHGSNSFGRTATASQPHFNGAKVWYRWSSVKASVDYTAPENKGADGGGDIAAYIRNQYAGTIDEGDIVSLFLQYAPPGDGNDTAGYTAKVKGWIKDMVDGMSGDAAAAPADGAAPIVSAGASGCCPTTDSLTGGTPAEQAFQYFIQAPRSLSPQAAAGIVGNMMTESGGNTPNLDTHAHNDISGTHDGIVQWSGDRWAALKTHERGKDPYDLAVQLDYVWYELSEGGYKSILSELKSASSPADAAGIINSKYEVSGDNSGHREANAQKVFVDYGGSASPDTAAGSVPAATTTGCATGTTGGNADLKKVTTVSTPGKFITMPSRYSCPGHTTKIDSRIAADVAYFVDHYNLCVDDGLASGHKSHGVGISVDMRPRAGNSKDDWKASVEQAAHDIGWYGDSADDPNKSQPACAHYVPDDYGDCGHDGHPDKFPVWVRWVGYNGDVDHGDPWHVYGGSYAHIHISWDTPNHDGVSPVIIPQPRASVYTFPAPVPDDLKDLVQ